MSRQQGAGCINARSRRCRHPLLLFCFIMVSSWSLLSSVLVVEAVLLCPNEDTHSGNSETEIRLLPVEGRHGLQQIQRKLIPALVMITPASCTTQCEQLAHFVRSISSRLEAKMKASEKSYYHSVQDNLFRLHCSDHADTCRMFGVAALLDEGISGSPLFVAWTDRIDLDIIAKENHESQEGGETEIGKQGPVARGAWMLQPYNGPTDPNRLVAWMEAVFFVRDTDDNDDEGYADGGAVCPAHVASAHEQQQQQQQHRQHPDATNVNQQFGGSLYNLSNNLQERRTQMRMTPFSVAAFDGDITTLRAISRDLHQHLLHQRETVRDRTNGQQSTNMNNNDNDIRSVADYIETTRNINGATALQLTAQAGHNEIVRFLLQEGANPNSKDRLGGTPLLMATLMGHVEVVATLFRGSGGDDGGAKDGTGSGEDEGTGATRNTTNRATVYAATGGHSFSLAEFARKEGHEGVLVALIQEVEGRELKNRESVEEEKDVHRNRIQRPDASTEFEAIPLPHGMKMSVCQRKARIEEAQCHLLGVCERQRQNTSSPSHANSHSNNATTTRTVTVADANDFECDLGTSCPFAPMGKLVTRLGKVVAAQRAATTFAFQATQVTNKEGHPKHGQLVPWWSVCGTNTDDDDAREQGGTQDVWQCLFGRGEHLPRPKDCYCDDGKEYPTVAIAQRDLANTISGALVLHGERTSPHLPNGAVELPFDVVDHNNNENGKDANKGENGTKTNNGAVEGITVSVHVRAGDSCDVVTSAANATAWAAWPFSWHEAKATQWARARRFCVHPSVHLSAVRALWEHYNNNNHEDQTGNNTGKTTKRLVRILLATDSQDAVDLFEIAIAVDMQDLELLVHRYDRAPFEHPSSGRVSTTPSSTQSAGQPLTQDQYWIEFRSERNATFAAQAVLTAMEDLRLLSRGSLLVGAMCGFFARAAHSVMIANHQGEIPVISVDRCVVGCQEEGMTYPHQG